jgi:hypothetical protein
VALGLIAWRWIVLGAHGEPVGVDIGNWLALGRHLPHLQLARVDVVYPPVVPLVVATVASVVGVPTAAHVLAAAAGLVPGVGVWYVLRSTLPTFLALAAALATLVGGATSAAAAWGGLPQLLGLGIAPCAVYAAARLPSIPTRRNALVFGGWMALLGTTSPLVFGVAGVAALVAAGLAAIARRDLGWLRCSGWAALPLLPIVPLYVTYLSRASLDSSFHVPGAPGARSLDALFVSASAAWVLLGVLALAMPIALWSRRREPLWAASTAMTTIATIVVAADLAPRWGCLAPTAVSIGAASLCGLATPLIKRSATVVCAMAVVAVVVAAPTTMIEQRDVYARLVPAGTDRAIAWLDAHTSDATRIAVAPVDGAPFGWIVEGWAHRPTLVAADPTWLLFPGERRAAATASALFTARHWPTDHTFSLARQAGVALLYVPSSWHGIDDDAFRRAAQRHPGLVAYRGTGALILRVPGVVSG